MTRIRLLATGSADSEAIRSEVFRGRTYTVVPVVALVEGVIQGLNAAEPEYAPADEFAKIPAAWNGRPITMDHPRSNGELCSANSPDILEEYQMGFIANSVRADDKLKMEAWLDDELITEKGGEFQDTKDRLIAGDVVVEVSTGLFTDTLKAAGKFNSVSYAITWQNVVPDHLAMLPAGAIGACSVEAGCGAPRLNASNPIQLPIVATNLRAVPAVAAAQPCCDGCTKGDPCMSTPKAHTETSTTPQEVPNDPASNGTAGEPANITTDTENQGPEGSEEAPKGPVGEAGEGNLPGIEDVANGSVEEVAAQIEANASLQRLTDNAIAASVTFENAREIVQRALREMYPGECESGCGCYHWDRPYVLAMNTEMVAFEARRADGHQSMALSYSISDAGGVTFTGEPVPVNLLVSIVPVPSEEGTALSTNEAIPGADQHRKEGQMADVTEAGTTPEGTGVNANGAAVVQPAPRTLAQYVEEAPPEISELLTEALDLRTQRRNKLITDIVTNAGGLFTTEELGGKTMADLLKLHALSQPKQDYSGRAVPNGQTEGISANSADLRDNQNTVPEAPRAFGAKAAGGAGNDASEASVAA